MITPDIVDLDGILPTQDHILDIVSLAGQPTGWKWTLAPRSHPKPVAYAEAEAQRELDRAKVIREAQFNGVRYNAEDNKTPEAARRENVQWVVARVISFTPVKIGGEVISHSDKAVEDLLIRPEMNFVLNQVVKALNTDALFTNRSAAA